MARREAAYEILIRLAEVDPPIWRRLIVSSGMTLHELHRTIQLIFSWYDYHLYEFQFGGARYEAPGPEAEGQDATRVTLADLRLSKGAELHYVYDFGDEWLHIIEIERMRVRSDGVELPWLADGERQGPPEDCGGPLGYSQLLESFNTPLEDLPDEARDKASWAGLNFDPEEFIVDQARHALTLATAWGALKFRSDPDDP
jgi:hypothetical protein